MRELQLASDGATSTDSVIVLVVQDEEEYGAEVAALRADLEHLGVTHKIARTPGEVIWHLEDRSSRNVAVILHRGDTSVAGLELLDHLADSHPLVTCIVLSTRQAEAIAWDRIGVLVPKPWDSPALARALGVSTSE